MDQAPETHQPTESNDENPYRAPDATLAAGVNGYAYGAALSGLRVARRVVVGVIGSTVVAIGVAMLVLPGPGLVVIPAGLGILGLEFAFARRWLRHLRERATHVAARVGASVGMTQSRGDEAGVKDDGPAGG